MESEPARWASLITAFLVALFGLAAAFGLPIDQAQRDAIIATVVPVVVLIFALGEWIRSRVYAPDTTKAIQDEAYRAGFDRAPKPDLAAPPATELAK